MTLLISPLAIAQAMARNRRDTDDGDPLCLTDWYIAVILTTSMETGTLIVEVLQAMRSSIDDMEKAGQIYRPLIHDQRFKSLTQAGICLAEPKAT